VASSVLTKFSTKFAAIGFAAMIGMTATLPLSVDAYAKGPESVADLAEGLLDAVVNISTSQTITGTDGPGAVPMPQLPEGSPFQDFFDEFFKNGPGGQGGGGGQNSRKAQSLGSGFVVDAAEGIVITNNHVIADADEITVNFTDGSKLTAKLVGTDTKTDIAVLKVDPKGKSLTAVKFGDSDKARIGDWVMAIGNPFGLGGTVTVGIISARNRDINSGPYDRFIQTDAAINRGNSGGPLFNMDGEVIGINSAIISPSGGSIGLGFSIPSELAQGVVAQLRQFGETRRGWLGVRIQPVTDDVAESLGMTKAEGALIAGVIKPGPVADGTLQAGDVVKEFNGKKIVEMRDLPRMVADTAVGQEVELLISRKGTDQRVKVKLGRLEDGEQQQMASKESGSGEDGAEAVKPADVSVLGMKLALLDDETRKKFEIAAEVKGVVITEVTPNSTAAEKEIAAGQVITEIAQEAVTKPEDITKKVEALKKEGRKNALLMVASKTGELKFVTLRID
jgi:serine protease Do